MIEVFDIHVKKKKKKKKDLKTIYKKIQYYYTINILKICVKNTILKNDKDTTGAF